MAIVREWRRVRERGVGGVVIVLFAKGWVVWCLTEQGQTRWDPADACRLLIMSNKSVCVWTHSFMLADSISKLMLANVSLSSKSRERALENVYKVTSFGLSEEIPTSVLHKEIHSSIKQSSTATYMQQRDGEGVIFYVTFTTRSHIKNCIATDSTHGIVIFRDTWGYFQTLMWRLKSAVSHSKSDHLHPWSWRPKASYKDWKGSYYLLTNAL